MGSFFEKVYELVKQIPEGRVTTYGEIASKLGTRDARKVGWALNKNPYEDEVPCHRVVNKAGGLAPSFAFGGSEEQYARLKKESVAFKEGERVVDLAKSLYTFR